MKINPVPSTDIILTRFITPITRWWGPRKDLDEETRKAFKLHTLGIVFSSTFFGIIGLTGLVLKKTMGAGDWFISIQHTAQLSMLVFSIFWVQFLEYTDHRRFIRMVGWLGRGGMLLAAFVVTPLPLVILIMMSGIGMSAFIPAANRIMQSNYSENIRGELVGYLFSRSTLTVIFCSLVFSYILDQFPQAYRILFPAGAVMGIIGAYAISCMPVHGHRQSKSLPDEIRRRGTWPVLGDIFVTPLRESWQFLKTEKEFMKFEGFFFLYGCGVISSWPLLTILLTDYLNLSYVKATIILAVIPNAVTLLLSPAMGRIYDRFNPLLIMSASTLLLGFYTVIMFFAHSFTIALIGVFFQALGMLGVHFAWSLSSIYFAGDKPAEPFMSMHVSLTGLRGIIAPFLGVALAQYLSLHKAFLLSTVFLWLCAFCMWRMHLKHRKKTPAATPAEEPAGDHVT
ncbi:MFS transporter [Planctomycetota bacterium]